MPFPQPTRAEILAQIKADFRLELGVDPMRRSVEYALVRAETGQSKAQYGFLNWAYRQSFPDTMDPENFWRWASQYIDQNPPAPWVGLVLVTGTNGTTIPAGTPILRSDGAAYEVTAEGEIAGGEALVSVSAVLASYGSAANNDDDQPLTISPPVLGLDSACIVDSTTTDGSDLETAEEGLVRLLEYLREPPSGGGPGDYVKWAKQVSGVTRAWEFPNVFGLNTVGVAFVRDNDGTGADILPSSGEREVVRAYVQSKAPITVTVTVITLVALPVDVEISGLDPDTAEVRTAVEAALADLFAREAEPDSSMAVSRFDAAISGAAGELDHTLEDPTAAVESTSAQMPILGTVSYV